MGHGLRWFMALSSNGQSPNGNVNGENDYKPWVLEVSYFQTSPLVNVSLGNFLANSVLIDKH